MPSPVEKDEPGLFAKHPSGDNRKEKKVNDFEAYRGWPGL